MFVGTIHLDRLDLSEWFVVKLTFYIASRSPRSTKSPARPRPITILGVIHYLIRNTIKSPLYWLHNWDTLNTFDYGLIVISFISGPSGHFMFIYSRHNYSPLSSLMTSCLQHTKCSIILIYKPVCVRPTFTNILIDACVYMFGSISSAQSYALHLCKLLNGFHV